ncbi:rRNA methyltransferase [Kocuria polaris]|nr:rRNA methyltransferase [Kocuria polaris]
MLESLRDYRRRFAAAADGYDASTERAADLEQLMGDFSAFVTDERNETPFAELTDVGELVADLRTQSARCAAVMEKYRALRLLEGRSGSVGYFANVESCIQEEFGAVAPTAASRVLLVGSGSFPMTLLNVAERTGAAAVGVDIDAEAVDLGRRVVTLLGGGFDIALENVPAEELDFTSNATHIVFSSTVPVKYDILHRLHSVTRDDVVVAMRFGDGLKSLFNYPMQDVDPARWRLLETVRRPGQVFDIALYAKHPAEREAE